MQEWETLRIATAQLCSRVEGFGVYTPLPGPKLLAGRRNAAIVYVELEHFTHRASSGPNGEPGYLVELGQELSLYHDADGLLRVSREKAVGARWFHQNPLMPCLKYVSA